MASDYGFYCDKCGQECRIEFDYDMAMASNDGENLEFVFDYTCENTVTGPPDHRNRSKIEECGAEHTITVYAKSHSIQVD